MKKPVKPNALEPGSNAARLAENFTDGIPEEDPSAIEHAPTLTILGLDQNPLLPGFEMSDQPLPPPTVANAIATAAANAEDYRADQQIGYTPGGSQDPPGTMGYTGLMDELSRTTDSYVEARNTLVRAAEPGSAAERLASLPNKPKPREARMVEPEVLDGGLIAYESRIRILDAWQYPGSIPKSAPVYVDRNWIGWEDYDPVRNKGPSPVLRVPMENVPDLVVICRPGDFVVRQEVMMGDDDSAEVKVEVWAEEQFVRMFMPRRMKDVSAA